MRGIGKHTPPSALFIVQDCPADNTSEYVVRQVRVWREYHLLVHPEIAREIASWWASGTNQFATFATTGALNKPELIREINREAGGVAMHQTDTYERDVESLAALRAYVYAAESLDDEEECEGHESLAGAHMGESVYCDGSCRN